MSGRSYLGTMCIGVAATGVEGLKTIIPEAGISNWYNYYRKNGLVAPAIEWQGDDIDILAKYCFSRAKDDEDYNGVKDAYRKVLSNILSDEDRDSGNYNRFWDERNYIKQVKNMKASALIIHGINDLNVMMNQNIPLWDELNKNGIQSKMILHQGDHMYMYNHETSEVLDIMHRWLDYHLYGMDNGVLEDVANVIVQNNLDQNTWIESEQFPPEGNVIYKFPIATDGIKGFVDDIEHTAFTLDDEKSDSKGNIAWRDELILPMDEEKLHEIKIVVDPEFKGETKRISGTIKISFDAALDKETGILSAMLVDYGLDKRITLEEEVVKENGRVWGRNTETAE
jgi:X-Pro dipeptidyl-peptidase